MEKVKRLNGTTAGVRSFRRNLEVVKEEERR